MAFSVRIVVVVLGLFGGGPLPAAPPDEFPPPPPGQLVLVGNHRLHIHCRGEGTPSIVIESGLGESALEWGQVQIRLSDHTRTCIYDRAGYGWSELGPRPRSSEQIATELGALLTNAGVEPPYLLLGHSVGGFSIRQFTLQHPQAVAALVLIDASHEAQFGRLERASGIHTVPTGSSFFLRRQSAVSENIPDEIKDLVSRFNVSPKTHFTVRNEIRWLRHSAREIAWNGKLLSIPVIVISRGRQPWSRGLRGDARERIWGELQRDLLTLSTDSRQVIARDSGHHIHLDQPDLIVAEVRALLERFGARTTAATVQAVNRPGATQCTGLAGVSVHC